LILAEMQYILFFLQVREELQAIALDTSNSKH
jgi:hypothetical protein